MRKGLHMGSRESWESQAGMSQPTHPSAQVCTRLQLPDVKRLRDTLDVTYDELALAAVPKVGAPHGVAHAHLTAFISPHLRCTLSCVWHAHSSVLFLSDLYSRRLTRCVCHSWSAALAVQAHRGGRRGQGRQGAGRRGGPHHRCAPARRRQAAGERRAGELPMHHVKHRCGLLRMLVSTV